MEEEAAGWLSLSMTLGLKGLGKRNARPVPGDDVMTSGSAKSRQSRVRWSVFQEIASCCERRFRLGDKETWTYARHWMQALREDGNLAGPFGELDATRLAGRRDKQRRYANNHPREEGTEDVQVTAT